MQAAVVNVLGETPRYQSFSDPAAGADEVLIQGRAAGLPPIAKGRAGRLLVAHLGHKTHVTGNTLGVFRCLR